MQVTRPPFTASWLLVLSVACTPTWYDYRDTANGVSVALPGSPHVESRELESPWGRVSLTSASVTLNERLRFWNRGFYGVAVGQLPGDVPEAQFIGGACGEIARSFGAEVTSDTPTRTGGHEGRDCELRAQEPAGVISARVVVAKGRLYFAYAGGKEEARTDDARRFFESFEVTPERR